jgi:quercetin dioxygenase-like cupin family protein
MADPVRPRHVPHDELPLLSGGEPGRGELRILYGSDHGLDTSVMSQLIEPGTGPMRHRHPHAEIFVLHEGEGRYEVDGTALDAVAGDMVIVPPDAWHAFTNTGDSLLRQTSVHQNARPTTLFEDGSRRD